MSDTSFRLWRTWTVLSLALAMGLAWAHLLEMPPKMQLDAQLYTHLDRTLYPYFAYVGGPVEVLAVICTDLPPRKLDGSECESSTGSGGRMRKSKFTEEQIIKVLKEVEAGAKVQDVVRRLGITETTFYRWKAKFGGLEVNEAKRLRALEDENRRLKTMVADQALDIQGLKHLLSKKW